MTFFNRQIYSPSSKGDWYSFAAAEQDGVKVGEIDIYGEISEWENSMQDLTRQIKATNADEIRVSISSPGGSIMHGLAIANTLREHKAAVTTEVTGIAASIASVIFAAGDERLMHDNTSLMIHNPWAATVGDVNDHLAQIRALQNLGGGIVRSYDRVMNVDAAAIETMMDDETWFSAEEAVENGLATAIVQSPEFQARIPAFNASIFKRTPLDVAEAAETASERAQAQAADDSVASDEERRRLRARWAALGR